MDESDCPTTPKEKQWEQNVTMVEEHSRIDTAANIVKPEGASFPGKGCCTGKVAEEEEPLIATPASLESPPPLRNLNHHLPTMSSKHAAEELSESGTRTCSGTVIAHSEKQIENWRRPCESWRRPCSETRYKKMNLTSQAMTTMLRDEIREDESE